MVLQGLIEWNPPPQEPTPIDGYTGKKRQNRALKKPFPRHNQNLTFDCDDMLEERSNKSSRVEWVPDMLEERSNKSSRVEWVPDHVVHASVPCTNEKNTYSSLDDCEQYSSYNADSIVYEDLEKVLAINLRSHPNFSQDLSSSTSSLSSSSPSPSSHPNFSQELSSSTSSLSSSSPSPFSSSYSSSRPTSGGSAAGCAAAAAAAAADTQEVPSSKSFYVPYGSACRVYIPSSPSRSSLLDSSSSSSSPSSSYCSSSAPVEVSCLLTCQGHRSLFILIFHRTAVYA